MTDKPLSQPNELTRDKILALAAGSVLDALVAEKVMEWDVETFNKQNCWWVRDCEINAYKPFHPSSDISAAWEVVRETGGQFSWSIQKEGHYFNEESMWEVRCGGMGELIKSKSVPGAICKAALLAVMDL